FVCFRREVLLGPALDLARDVVLAAAIIGQADGGGVVAVELRQGRIHRIVHRGALSRSGRGHFRFPEHAPFDMRHDEEGFADDRIVRTIENRRRHREALGVERADYAVFTVDRMRRRQKLAGRFAPKYVAPRWRLDQVGRVGLAALELLDGNWAGEAFYVVVQIRLQAAGIEA